MNLTFLNKNNKNKNTNINSNVIPLYITALLFACYLNATWLIITFSLLLIVCILIKALIK